MKENPYLRYEVYGPYLREDGRSHVCLVHSITKQKKTVSYPKHKMEMKSGRLLSDNEEVHHLDGDISNNEDSNLVIVTNEIHGIVHSKHNAEEVECVECKTKFILTAQQVSERYRNRNRRKDGPFCSRSCSGKFTRRKQSA